MNYEIVFVREERIMFRTPWESGLESAKRYASDHIAIRKADRVEVRDERDALVFRQSRGGGDGRTTANRHEP